MKLQDATPGTHGVLTLGETRIVGTVKVEFEEGRFFRADRTSWSNVHYYADGWEFTPDSTTSSGDWYRVGIDGRYSTGRMQELADRCGFDVLWEGDDE